MHVTISTATKNSEQKPKNTTWLQGMGYAYGKPAGELKIGDVIGLSYEGTAKVVEIIKETKSFITIMGEEEDPFGNPALYERKFKKNRIVAIAE